MSGIEFPPPYPAWASWIKDRSPQFKFHKNVGHAKNAISLEIYRYGARGGRIFNWYDDQWNLIYDVAPGTPHDELPWRNNE